METKELINKLGQPTLVTSEEVKQLERLLEKYPYFQAARAVYLKGLYSGNSVNYNYELKKTAAYTVDRSVLFDFITSKEFIQDKVALQIQQQEDVLRNITVFEPQEVFGTKTIALNEAVKMKKTESERVLDPNLFERPASSTSTPAEAESKPEEKPIITGVPLDFDQNEAHSFSEWLKLTSAKPINREVEETDNLRERKFELIDDFISKSPKINTSRSPVSNNLAQDSITPPEALMTETLARVYLEQKNYKKAMQAYKILILKNPEKSGFFADQIRAIKKLQENNTGKE